MSESSSHHSVSGWLSTVNSTHGEADTAWRHLWERYAPGMTELARGRLTPGRKPLADEEDVVVEVFKALFRGVQGGRFAHLSNRDDLQQILIMLTQRRAVDAARRNGVRTAHEIGESALQRADVGDGSDRPIERIAAADDPPDAPALARDELARLLDNLQDETLRHIAMMRVCSSSDEEIAEAIGLSVRSVQHKLQLIAGRWRKMLRRDLLSPQDLRQAFQYCLQANDPP
jgi:DNA-directed RNA polymerase specialized sigma24 family protein